MKILLMGYGKMGKVIERFALERGHTIAARIDINNQSDFDQLTTNEVDVVIEFSHPLSAFENIKKCITKGFPTVAGTTGWLDKKPEIEQLTIEKEGTFLYASNYSIGVNLFFELNKKLAQLMNPYSFYEVNTREVHHTEKKDAPSGTAITLAEGLITHLDGKNKWVNNEIAQVNEIPIWSEREGKVPGTHIVRFISDVDEIEISHKATSREGFALGAVVAAEWAINKKGVLNLTDLFSEK
ncbi:MAG: 4-hydroxy-tetrahydrodipicolinate reductase [Bacteroidota bacterium]